MSMSDNINANGADAPAAQGKLFRKSVNGFNRQDVMEYIEHMVRDRRRDAERYSAHIRSMDEEQNALKEDSKALEIRIMELTRDLEEAREKLEANERDAESLITENDTLNEKLRGALAELDALKSADRAEDKPSEEKETASPEIKETKTQTESPRVYDDAPRDGSDYREKLESLIAELSEMRRVNESYERGFPEKPAPERRGGAVADVIRRVQEKPQGLSPGNLRAIRSRMYRLRNRTRDGIEECASLYEELLRDLDTIEELLKEQNA